MLSRYSIVQKGFLFGVAMQFPGSQFYPNSIVNLKFYRWIPIWNIPILPEAFLTFASKSSVGPSYVTNGQEDHITYTNLNDDTVIMVNNCYFDSIAQYMSV